MIRADDYAVIAGRGTGGDDAAMAAPWRQRDDQHLVKPAAPLSVDPIDKLCRIVMKLKSAMPKTNARYIMSRYIM